MVGKTEQNMYNNEKKADFAMFIIAILNLLVIAMNTYILLKI